jgi:hypothetical protein
VACEPPVAGLSGERQINPCQCCHVRTQELLPRSGFEVLLLGCVCFNCSDHSSKVGMPVHV